MYRLAAQAPHRASDRPDTEAGEGFCKISPNQTLAPNAENGELEPQTVDCCDADEPLQNVQTGPWREVTEKPIAWKPTLEINGFLPSKTFR